MKLFKRAYSCYSAIRDNVWLSKALDKFDAMVLSLMDLRMPKDPNRPDIVELEKRILYSASPLFMAGDGQVGDPSGDFTDGSNMSPDEWQSYLTELTTNSDCEAVHKIAAEIRAARGLSAPVPKIADHTLTQVADEVPVADSDGIDADADNINASDANDTTNDDTRSENRLDKGLDRLERFVEQLSSTVPAPEIAESSHGAVRYLNDVASSFALDAAPEQLGQLFYNEGLHHEVVFVQAGLQDSDALIADIESQASALGRSISVILLNGTENGFDQIDSVLSQYHDLSAIHFVSHGTDGMIQLGGSWLSAANVQDHLIDLQQWGMDL
ncbi:MAG TPA: DUF4347 domain-containing protein, partial [Pirellula sp.]|nr:DUF4347 domain-containing protein [Pirellula sp.]